MTELQLNTLKWLIARRGGMVEVQHSVLNMCEKYDLEADVDQDRGTIIFRVVERAGE